MSRTGWKQSPPKNSFIPSLPELLSNSNEILRKINLRTIKRMRNRIPSKTNGNKITKKKFLATKQTQMVWMEANLHYFPMASKK